MGERARIDPRKGAVRRGSSARCSLRQMVVWARAAAACFAVAGALIIVLLVPAVAVGTTKAPSGLSSVGEPKEAPEYSYSNECLGLQLPLPSDWHFISDAEEGQVRLLKKGQILNASDRALVDGSMQENASNIIVGLINIRGGQTSIRNGNDYLTLLSKRLSDPRLGSVISEVTEQQLGDSEFSTVAVQMTLKGTTVYQRFFAQVTNGYILNINAGANSPERLDSITEPLTQLRISPVSSTTDSDGTCEALRRRVSPY